MDRFFLHKIKIALVFLCSFLGVQMVNSQAISSPNLGFGNACVSAGFNTYNVTGTFSPGGFSAANTFQLQLSDKEGNFPENPEVIATAPTNTSTSTIEFNDFAFPITVGSDTYRLRIFATEGGITGQRSGTFGAYYYDGTVYRLEPRCLSGGGTFAAEPSDFDSYLWFKVEGNSTVLIAGETSSTLTVTEEGRYFFTRDFGVCQSANTFPQSNFSDVVASQGTQVSITQNGPIVGCSDDEITLTGSTNSGGINYSWTKDDVLVEDITDPDFTIIGSAQTTSLTVTGLGMEGSYKFEVRSSVDDQCAIQSDPVEIQLQNPKISITSETTVLLIPPGEPKTLTSEVIRGEAPRTITWFRIPPNETTPQAVPGGTTENINVTEAGTYFVRLDANSPCPEDNTVDSAEQVQVVPAENLTVTIAYQDPNYEDCELSQTVLEVREVTATVNGELVVLDEAALQSIVVDWQRDGVSTGETGRTILINNASENGVYRAVIEGEPSSNLSVILGLDSFTITKTPEELPLDGEIELSLGLDDTTGYTFEWFRNTNEAIPNSNSATIIVDEPGVYTAQVFFSTCGGVTVDPVTVTTGSPVIPGVITPNGDGINDDWVLPFDFTQQANVEVNVYASNGELDYSTVNYNGEWPQESKSKAVGTVYYYVINVDNNPVEQGSITIIR